MFKRKSLHRFRGFHSITKLFPQTITKPYNLFDQSYGSISVISHHIIPLVVHNLRDGHTHTCVQTFMDRSNSKKPSVLYCSQSAPGLTRVANSKIGQILFEDS